MKVWLGFRDKRFREPFLKKATLEGMKALGWERVDHLEECNLAIWWGIPPTHTILMKRLLDKKIPVLIIDFPFWGRAPVSDVTAGYYKISLNGVSPHDYLDAGGQDAVRYRKIGGPEIRPWKKGNNVLIAGMGPKSCAMFGMEHGEWDGNAVRTILQHTQRKVIYRQKPSDKFPIVYPGTVNDTGIRDISHIFDDCHAVVTHHGNSGVEALAHGIPVFSERAITKYMGRTDLTKIETPVYPENREEFFHSICLWQWHYSEIAQGLPFVHLKERGLI